MTLVVFCEIWAPICKTELPKLAAREHEFTDVGFGVIGLTRVTKSASDEAVMTFLADNGIGFPFGKVRFPLDPGTDMRVWGALHTDRAGVAVLVAYGKIVWAGRLTNIPYPAVGSSVNVGR
ncbi:MAG: redoxin domain-containing protein [Myxococcota bacterium]